MLDKDHVTDRHHDDERGYSWQPGDPYYRGGHDKTDNVHHERPRDSHTNRETDHPRQDYDAPEEHPARYSSKDNDRPGNNAYDDSPVFDYPDGLYDMTDNSPAKDDRAPEDRHHDHHQPDATRSSGRHDSQHRRDDHVPEKADNQSRNRYPDQEPEYARTNCK
jgi:hypothetical protein